MKPIAFWARVLFPLGLACVLVGSLDPLEGSLLILPGFGILALDAALTHGRFRVLLNWAFALVTIGVASMWILSSFGGVRFGSGTQGVSGWWGLTMLPYPIGWIAGIVGVWRTMAERRRGPVSGAPSVT